MDALLSTQQIPFKFRRKSSSASSSGSIADFRYDYADYRDSSAFSPLPPSSPVDTYYSSYSPQSFSADLMDPLYVESAVDDDDYDSTQEDQPVRWSYRSQDMCSPKPLQPRESRYSLLRRYGLYLASGDESSASQKFMQADDSQQTGQLSSDVLYDSADEDLYESESPRVRKTYFAVSEERGRWQSSPIPVRTHIRETFPSSPIPQKRHRSPDITSQLHIVHTRKCTTTTNVFSAVSDERSCHNEALPPSSSSPAPTSPLQSNFLALPPTGAVIGSCSNDPEPEMAKPTVVDDTSEEYDDQDMFRFSSSLPPSSLPASPMSIEPVLDDGADIEVDISALSDDDTACTDEAPLPQTSCSLSTVDETPMSRVTRVIDDDSGERASISPSTPVKPKRQLSFPPISSLEHEEEVMLLLDCTPSSIPPSTPPSSVLLDAESVRSGWKVSSSPPAKTPLVNKKNEPHPGQESVISSAPLSLGTVDTQILSVLPSGLDLPMATISLSVQSAPSGEKQIEQMDVSFHVNDEGLGSSHKSLMHEDATPCKSHSDVRDHASEQTSKAGAKRESGEPNLENDQECSTQKRRRLENAGDEGIFEANSKSETKGQSRSRSRKTGRMQKTDTSRSRSRPGLIDLDRDNDPHDPHPSSTPHPSPSTPSSSNPTEDSHTELTGMLVECLGTSRASSMVPSALHTALLRSHPALKTLERTKKEWSKMISSLLTEGEERCGMFGKIESSGKDEKDRPLEARWFYVPEKDEDQERAAVISSLMPRPMKRSETRKYKQYYYRPLDKLSRWDPEDAI